MGNYQSTIAAAGAGFKCGTYTGDGTDDRDIDIGIDLASKTNVYIYTKYSPGLGQVPMHRIEYGQGDLTMDFTNAADIVNCIQGLTSTGFQVGSSPKVNLNTATYAYYVMYS